MRQTVVGLLALCAAVFAASDLEAQREPEPYQTVGVGLGWGAMGPVGGTGLDGSAADGGAGILFGLDLEIKQTNRVFVYGRGEADAADVRQHLGFAGGIRLRPGWRGRVRPFVGAGAGFIWIEPRVDLSSALSREIALRGEAVVGGELRGVPGLRWFTEYRISAARFTAVVDDAGCGPDGRCLIVSERAVLHLGHSVWLGMRIKLF